MTIDVNLAQEYAQKEGIRIIKELLIEYPNDKELSGAIILQSLENAMALAIIGTEKQIKPKELMKIFSQNVTRKVRFMKENIKDMKAMEQSQTKLPESQLDQSQSD